MFPLDDAEWSSLSDAYGSASGIVGLLIHAEALPEDTGSTTEPYCSLWSGLCHQGDIYSASYAALPHLVRIVEKYPDKFRWTLLSLVQAIETARLGGRGPSIPANLQTAYDAALQIIPTIAVGLIGRGLSELEMRVILSACAAAKGFGPLSEAITELTPEYVKRLLEE